MNNLRKTSEPAGAEPGSKGRCSKDSCDTLLAHLQAPAWSCLPGLHLTWSAPGSQRPGSRPLVSHPFSAEARTGAESGDHRARACALLSSSLSLEGPRALTGPSPLCPTSQPSPGPRCNSRKPQVAHPHPCAHPHPLPCPRPHPRPLPCPHPSPQPSSHPHPSP